MKRSGIHYGQRNKQSGQNDLEDQISLKQYLVSELGFKVKRDWWICFRDDYIHSISETILESYLDSNPGLIIRHPDLMFYYRDRLTIVEIDGKAHDHYVTKTVDRNKLYRDHDIQLIVLNKSELKLQNKTLLEGLQDGLKRLS